MYLALESTISSKSQLTTLDYESMKKLLFKTIAEDENSGITDKELLEKYFKGLKNV